MEVDVRIKEFLMVSIEQIGALLGDMGIAQLLADHRSVLGFHQGIVVGMSGAGFGETDQELVEQPGHIMIDKFGSVVRVKTQNGERELA